MPNQKAAIAFEGVLECVATCVESSDKFEVAQAVLRAMEIAMERTRILPEYFSIRDLEERWGLERKAVERLRIPRVKIGGAIRFARDDVTRFEAAHRSEPE